MPKSNFIKLSVAIATYNHANYLEKSLSSVFQQEHDYPFEIVISDDFSTDGTQDIINDYHRKYPNIIRPSFQQKNMGVSKNSLHLLDMCRGEYVATLDGDDYWTDPHKIKTQISFLDTHPEFVLSCHRYQKQHFDTKDISNDSNAKLFKANSEGFEFGLEKYFEQWITQTLTVVFRNSILKNISILETYRYCWDTQIFWTLLTKGKGYIHNFFGGVYRIHSNGVWSGNNETRHDCMMYLIIEELLQNNIAYLSLKKNLQMYRYRLLNTEIKKENMQFLDLSKINDKNFTIICDDSWGGEVYKAMNLQERSPFIGINIYNADFIELVSKLKYYLAKPLEFIDLSRSKYIKDFKHTYGREYPIAWLDGKVELHFTDYSTTEYALSKWNERVKRINWNNLFIKMDASRERENTKEIVAFSEINFPYTNKICFASTFLEKEIDNALKEHVVFIDYWNPEMEIFFPLSHFSFNVISWLNGGSGKYTVEEPFSYNMFVPEGKKYYVIRFDHHFFVQFNEHSIKFLDSYFPNAITVNFDDENGAALIRYNKSELEHFRLSAGEDLPDLKDYLDLFIDLRKKEDRHIFILAKGDKNHKLRVDFVPWEKAANYDGAHLNVHGLEQEIPEEFEWMHFDLSIAQMDELDYLFEQIKSFCFYINPGEEAKGTMEVLAVFIGSISKFEETLSTLE